MYMNVVFRKSVCSVITAIFGMSQVAFSVSRAADVSGLDPTSNEMASFAKSANSLGKTLGEKYRDAAPSWDGSNINFQAGGQNFSINKNELVPKADGEHIKYSSSEADFEKQKDIWNNKDQMNELGSKQKDSLFENAQSDNPTIEGRVYQLLVDEAKTERTDMSKESFLQKSQDILDNLKKEIENIIQCKTDSTLASSGSYKHIPDIQTCQQVLDRSQTCKIKHNYSNGAIEYERGPYNVSECKDGTANCTQMWLGTVGDNYWAGSCTIYEENIYVSVTNPGLIVKATLDYAKWDDYMQVWLGPENGTLTKVWSGPNDNFPPETAGACELNTSWSRNLDVDVTKFFTDVPKNTILHFKTRTSVSGNGEGFARMKIIYDPNKVVQEEEWDNPDCMEALQGVSDGMAEGSVSCIKMPSNVDSSGCFMHNGVKVCRSMLGEPPFDAAKYNIDKLCQLVEVKSNFVFYKGDTGCWTGLVGYDDKGKPQYEEVCGGENAGGNLDTCKEYENKGCQFLKSECTEGMTGASGTCYVNDVTYDCGKDVKVGNDVLETTTSCQGIACAGEDCVDADRTTNTNFGKVSALLQMADYASEDMACEGIDDDGNLSGVENVTCKVFGGTAGKCKIAVGGWQDCCDSPQSAGMSAYISMTMAAKGAHQATAALTDYAEDWALSVSASGASSLPTGAQTIWNIGSQYTQAIGQVGNVLAEGTGYLGKAVSSVFDTFTGMYDAAKKAVNELIDKVFGELINQIKEYMKKMLIKLVQNTGLDGVIGGGASSAGSTAAAEAATEAMATYAAAAFAVVSWIYLAYQVANLIVNLVYKCEEEEYELDAKRDAKNCHYVGSYCSSKKLGICIVKKKAYCCFQSALSRIVNEQIRKTQPEVLAYGGDGGWGSAKHPICDGVPVSKIDSIDWDLIDLSEWEGMVAETGNIAQTDKDLTMEKLTGSGNKHQNYNGKRENVEKRNNDAMQGQDVDQLRIQAARCFSMYLGSDQYTGGECTEVSTDKVTCRKDGHIVSCDEIARDNMLNDLIDADHKSAEDYTTEGKRCYRDGIAIDCSTLYDERLAKEVLENYATIIGGTTFKDKYVCQDLTGTYTEGICEAAIKNNTCQCQEQVGQFVCRLGAQIIDCADLGTNKDEECPATCTRKDTEGYVCEKTTPNEPYDGAYCEELSSEETEDPDLDKVPDGAYCEELDAGKDPDIEVPDEGYYCVGDTEDADDDDEISDWIIDVEPTCTTPGSKHKENKKTGEIVKKQIITKVCTSDMEDGAASDSKPK